MNNPAPQEFHIPTGIPTDEPFIWLKGKDKDCREINQTIATFAEVQRWLKPSSLSPVAMVATHCLTNLTETLRVWRGNGNHKAICQSTLIPATRNFAKKVNNQLLNLIQQPILAEVRQCLTQLAIAYNPTTPDQEALRIIKHYIHTRTLYHILCKKPLPFISTDCHKKSN